jgi:hypothetical protein
MPSPPLVVPNATQIRLMYSLDGVGAFNVLHARKGASQLVNQALVNLIGAAIKTAWSTFIGPHARTSAALVRVGLRDLSTANQPEFLDTGAIAGGTLTDDTLPQSNAVNVTLRTDLSGKSNRGRVYVGGFTEAANGPDGTVDPAISLAAVNFVDAVDDALVAQSMKLVVLSRPAYSYVDNRTWTFADGRTEVDVIGRGNARTWGMQDVRVIQSRDNKWESQRRRTNGRGPAPALLTAVAQKMR